MVVLGVFNKNSLFLSIGDSLVLSLGQEDLVSVYCDFCDIVGQVTSICSCECGHHSHTITSRCEACKGTGVVKVNANSLIVQASETCKIAVSNNGKEIAVI